MEHDEDQLAGVRQAVADVLGGDSSDWAGLPISTATVVPCRIPPSKRARRCGRFPMDDGRSPEHWFSEASSVGLGGPLEFSALETALRRSANRPEHLYVALNPSPNTCLDARLPMLLKQSGLAADRIVLEVTERLPVDEYAPLLAALAHLRQGGQRIAVDDAGADFSSMRHILRLRPEIFKT